MKKELTPHERLKRFYYAMFGITGVLGIANIIYIICLPDWTAFQLFFCALQYLAMTLILVLPIVLRKRFMVHVPLALTVLIAIFAFVAMIMGDGMDFYSKFTWWDKGLHLLSGGLLTFVGLWIMKTILPDNTGKLVHNRYFIPLYILLFGLACGTLWEITEYTFDDLFGTNTQQFMMTTTGSLPDVEDVPLVGHDALRDTMTDLYMDFLGSLIVSIWVLVRHNKLIEKYEAGKLSLEE